MIRKEEEGAWWEVDLGQQLEIATIRSYFSNRRRSRYRFTLLVSNTRREVLKSSLFRSRSSNEYHLPSKVEARYVRLELVFGASLSLKEVEVFGCFLNGELFVLLAVVCLSVSLSVCP